MQPSLFPGSRQRLAQPIIPSLQTQGRSIAAVSSLRQQLNARGTSASAGAALDQLKRTADRFVEDQEKAKQSLNQYVQKLQDSQQKCANLESCLTQERKENAQLRARVKDDQMQVKMVLDKMAVVQALHDGLKATADELSSDINRVDGLDKELRRHIDNKTKFCEDFADKCTELNHEQENTKKKLQEATASMVELQSHYSQCQSNLDSSMKKSSELQNTVDELKVQTSERVSELKEQIQQANERLQELMASRNALESEYAGKKSKLEEACSALQLKVDQCNLSNCNLAEEMRHAFKKHEEDESKIMSLQEQLDHAVQQEQKKQQEVQNLKNEVGEVTKQLQGAMEEAKMVETRLEEMSMDILTGQNKLKEAENDKAVLTDNLQEAQAKNKELEASLTTHTHELHALREELASVRTTTAGQQSEIEAQLAAKTSELDAARIAAADMQQCLEKQIAEAQENAEKKLQRFAERTAKELEGIQNKTRIETEERIGKYQEQVSTSETENQRLQEHFSKLEKEARERAGGYEVEKCRLRDEMADLKGSTDKKVKEMHAAHNEELEGSKMEHNKFVADLRELHKRELDAANEQVSEAQKVAKEVEKLHKEDILATRTHHTLERENMTKEFKEQLSDALEQSEEQTSRLHEMQNKIQRAHTQMIELEAQLKVARVEIEKKDMLLQQLNGRIRDLQEQGAALMKRKGAKPTPAQSQPFSTHHVKEASEQTKPVAFHFGSPTASMAKVVGGQESEAGLRPRRDKRKRGEVLLHTVARPSRTRFSGRTMNTVITADPRRKGKRYKKGNVTAAQKSKARVPAAKDIFGEVSAYDSYTFE